MYRLYALNCHILRKVRFLPFLYPKIRAIPLLYRFRVLNSSFEFSGLQRDFRHKHTADFPLLCCFSPLCYILFRFFLLSLRRIWKARQLFLRLQARLFRCFRIHRNPTEPKTGLLLPLFSATAILRPIFRLPPLFQPRLSASGLASMSYVSLLLRDLPYL